MVQQGNIIIHYNFASLQCHAQGSDEGSLKLLYSRGVLQTFLQPCFCTSYTSADPLLASNAHSHLGFSASFTLVPHHG